MEYVEGMWRKKVRHVYCAGTHSDMYIYAYITDMHIPVGVLVRCLPIVHAGGLERVSPQRPFTEPSAEGFPHLSGGQSNFSRDMKFHDEYLGSG